MPTPPTSLIQTLLAAATALVGMGPSVASNAALAPAPIVVQAPAQVNGAAIQVTIAPTATVRTAFDLPLTAQRVDAPFGPVLPIDGASATTPEPATAVPAVPTGAQRAPSNPQEAFIFQIAAGGQQSQRATGVPASVTIAQAILESSWGRSYLAREANNLFGIKGLTKQGPAGVVWIDAWEVENGQDVTVPQPFRKYNTMAESVVDHGMFFIENRRYAPAFAAKDDPKEFARRIANAGYATDPDYAPKLIALMDRYQLYQWDV